MLEYIKHVIWYSKLSKEYKELCSYLSTQILVALVERYIDTHTVEDAHVLELAARIPTDYVTKTRHHFVNLQYNVNLLRRIVREDIEKYKETVK